MTLQKFLLRFLGLALFTLLGGTLYAVTFNLLVAANLTPDPEMVENFGRELTLRTVFVLMTSVIAGFAGIFVQGAWRFPLYFAPLYAPSLFAALYTISNH